MKRVVMFSGGISSFSAALRVERPATLLFADTAMEDADLYRFVAEAAAFLGGELVTLRDGRTPWDVFRDVRFIGNTRVDPCSRILKREPLRKWMDDNCDARDTTVYLGFDWTEGHRLERGRKHWEPWRVECPLSEPPLLSKDDMLNEARACGIEPPRLYHMGFPHNNCGGFCVKAGQAHFAHLLKVMPERYGEHEAREEMLRKTLGDVAILRDRRGGTTKPLTLSALRERVASGSVDGNDWGGCSCLLPDDANLDSSLIPEPKEPTP